MFVRSCVRSMVRFFRIRPFVMALHNQAQAHQVVHYPVQSHRNGLQSLKVGLIFQATPEYFIKGLLRLQCSATITLTYQFEATEYLIGGTSRNKSNGYYWTKGKI